MIIYSILRKQGAIFLGWAYAVGADALYFKICVQLHPRLAGGVAKRLRGGRKDRSAFDKMWLSDSKLRLTSDNRKTLIGRSPVRVYEAGGSFPDTKTDAKKVTPAHAHGPTLVAGTKKHD